MTLSEGAGRIPVVIDCDPGVDDALAILLAASRRDVLELLAVTTVAGNAGIDETTRNAGAVLSLTGCDDIPLYRGAHRPLMRAVGRRAPVHGADGLGGETQDLRARPADPEKPAWVALCDIVRSRPGAVTLCVLGPMTNVALAILTDPGFAARVREIVFMGGAAFTDGNVTASAEFNIFVDPHAAQIVMESGIPLTMTGLDVTRDVVVSRSHIEETWARYSDRAAVFSRMVSCYADGDPALHDPCVIAWLLDPSAFTTIRGRICVDCREGPDFGRTVVARREKHMGPEGPNATILMRGDVARITGMIGRALEAL